MVVFLVDGLKVLNGRGSSGYFQSLPYTLMGFPQFSVLLCDRGDRLLWAAVAGDPAPSVHGWLGQWDWRMEEGVVLFPGPSQWGAGLSPSVTTAPLGGPMGFQLHLLSLTWHECYPC